MYLNINASLYRIKRHSSRFGRQLAFFYFFLSCLGYSFFHLLIFLVSNCGRVPSESLSQARTDSSGFERDESLNF